MPAHAEISHVVKENHTRGASGIDGLTEQGADDYIRSAGFGYNRRAKAVVLKAEALEAIRQWPSPKIWSAADHKPCRLTSRVRVDDPNLSVFNSHSACLASFAIYAATGFAFR